MAKNKKSILKKVLKGAKEEGAAHEKTESKEVEAAEEDGMGGPMKKYKNLTKK